MRAFLKQSGHFIAFGFLLTFLSGFGQTFLISLYVPHFQSFFDLSDAGFSSLYAAATLASAFTLTWLGRFIDKMRLTRYVLRVMLGLCAALILLSQSYYLPMLLVGLYGARLFGQGLLTHSSITSMARFFDANRGKAIGLASLGHPASEAIMPILTVSAIGVFGWRYGLLGSMLVVLLSIGLVFWLLLKNKRASVRKLLIPINSHSDAERQAAKPWRILKSKAFWILAPSNFTAASIGTAVIFFQLKLGDVKAWSPTFMAASFVAYALASALSTLLAGWLTDKFGAKILYPIYLMPFMLALLALYFFDGLWVYVVLVAGIGSSGGFGNTVKSAALAEIYGVRIIGSVRSLFITVMVFSTALGPLVFGLFLDAGVAFETLALGSFLLMAIITLNATRIVK